MCWYKPLCFAPSSAASDPQFRSRFQQKQFPFVALWFLDLLDSFPAIFDNCQKVLVRKSDPNRSQTDTGSNSAFRWYRNRVLTCKGAVFDSKVPFSSVFGFCPCPRCGFLAFKMLIFASAQSCEVQVRFLVMEMVSGVDNVIAELDFDLLDHFPFLNLEGLVFQIGQKGCTKEGCLSKTEFCILKWTPQPPRFR